MRGCGRIWIIMGGHDLHDVFLPAGVAFGGRPRPGIGRGCGAHLNPGVHVGFVIEADVNDILVIFRRARKRLKTDVKRSAIACESHEPEYHPSPGS